MPALPYEYAIVRAVPDVERGETVNLGVIVYAPEFDHLACRIEVPRACLSAMAPALDLDALEQHVAAIRWVCAGDERGAPIAQLPLRERFHWLAHPRSAVVVVSEVHAGLSEELDATLNHLFERLVARG